MQKADSALPMDEIKTKFKKFSNFTQMIWNKTEKIGVGYKMNQGKCLVVVQYEPSGNIFGSFKENVKPAESED